MVQVPDHPEGHCVSEDDALSGGRATGCVRVADAALIAVSPHPAGTQERIPKKAVQKKQKKKSVQQKRRCYQRRFGAPNAWNRPTSTGAGGSDPLWLCWRG
jgi:hypothetical protein